MELEKLYVGEGHIMGKNVCCVVIRNMSGC